MRYGPGGVALYVEVTTDNKNRTSSEMRKIFSEHGGSLGETGCVSWMFEKKGEIKVDPGTLSDDEVLLIAADAGAEDVTRDGEDLYVYTSPVDLFKVKTKLEENGIKIIYSEFTMIPKNSIKIEGEKAEQLLKLINDLDDHDDVQKVYANFEISDEEMERIALSLK